MNESVEYNRDFTQARKLQAEGQLEKAEQAFQKLLSIGKHREDVLRALVELYMQGGRVKETIDMLVVLTEQVPDRLYYYARLGALLDGIGETEAAIGHYLRLLERQPEYANAHFNLALLYKKSKRYADSASAYEAAIRYGIDNIQEVYSNMGVLYTEMRQRDMAIEMYNTALNIDAEYIPALFNLAGIYEGSGDRQRATELYKKILSIDTQHWDSLARLAYINKVSSDDSHLIDSLQQATEKAGEDLLAREGLHFALGKAFDDLGQYEQACAAYLAANELGKQRNPPYDKNLVEQYFNQLLQQFTLENIERNQTGLTARPIFICGMFRSGSTLIEQVLGSHPEVTAGGELEFLSWLIENRMTPHPGKFMNASLQQLESMSNDYLGKLQELFPDAAHITDKRPDNFLFLGVIKMLFPSARIIYTRRAPLDNCLSVYFQQLGGNLNYATELENIAHYYGQHTRLMTHWLDCFGENIYTVDYDQFVNSPESVLRPLLNFLGLEWSDQCLQFYASDNLVQTASVWQVRDELHTHSSGRWRNYASLVQGIQARFQ